MKFAGITDVRLFSRGKRGIIYTGQYNGKKVAIKTARLDSKALGNIGREGRWLVKLNTHGIGPTVLQHFEDYFVYIFVEGVFLSEYIRRETKANVKNVLLEVLRQCCILDTLKVNKEEMHHPHKHILVGKSVVMIDFERAKTTLRPCNVTQFVQYLCTGLHPVLKQKGIDIDKEAILHLAQEYKDSYDERVYKKLCYLLQ